MRNKFILLSVIATMVFGVAISTAARQNQGIDRIRHKIVLLEENGVPRFPVFFFATGRIKVCDVAFDIHS